MTKESFVAAYAEKFGVSKAEAERNIMGVLDLFVTEAQKAIGQGEKATLPGILSLTKKVAAPRTGRNPKTGEQIHIPARDRIKVTLATKFEQTVLNKAE